ncbi:MAG: hypothetical protein ACOZBW_01370 [Thermodesulfobacteriota bacterium]
MSDRFSRTLLIAVLVIVAINLVLTAVQTGLQLGNRQGIAEPQSVAGPSLPLSERELLALAQRVLEPINARDWNQLWELFDDYAKNQMSREAYASALEPMLPLLGTASSPSFAGSEPIQNQGGLPAFALHFVVSLSGGNFSTGALDVTIIQRERGPGIVSVNIRGLAR